MSRKFKTGKFSTLHVNSIDHACPASILTVSACQSHEVVIIVDAAASTVIVSDSIDSIPSKFTLKLHVHSHFQI